jgi:hypothetical protein
MPAACALQHRLTLSGVLELLLATYSLSGDRNPPATPLYSGDEAQIREALADVILAHAAAAAAVTTGQAQEQVQQAALGVLHEQLQCLPQTQRLVMEVSGVFAGWASLGRCPALAA